MAKPNHIQDFPVDINRDYFGAWLSGFTDGEGCFNLRFWESIGHPLPRARFQINIRADDIKVLQLTQMYLGCGRISVCKWKSHLNAMAKYVVENLSDLIGKVIPHFDFYPLIAKKKNDYTIWRTAVVFMSTVKKETPRNNGNRRMWTEANLAAFAEILDSLKRQREFNASVVPINPPPRLNNQRTLF